MTVTVVGLGRIGLPLAVQYARSGERVIGADVDTRVVTEVNGGRAPFPGEQHLAGYLKDVVGAGLLTATTDTTGAVARSDVVVVVVPLVVDENDAPDFDRLDSATEDIGRGLHPGVLVIYETTLPVGTTRNRWRPRLAATSGLTEGDHFHVAFSPERVLTGRVFADLRTYPKIVGGLSEDGTKLAVAFYEHVLQFDERPDLSRPNGVWPVDSTEAAEMVKLAETTYRDVNIGLANQFAQFAFRVGIDVHQVIEASNSQPYSHIHRPGISVGGHCIPVYPRLYLWHDPQATIVREARTANALMPDYVAAVVRDALGGLAGRRVLVLGAGYRAGVKETAFSGVFRLVQRLAAAGAEVSVHDPLHSASEITALGLTAARLGDPVDVAILHTDHRAYGQLTLGEIPGVTLILDGRGFFTPEQFPGVQVIVIGQGRRV